MDKITPAARLRKSIYAVWFNTSIIHRKIHVWFWGSLLCIILEGNDFVTSSLILTEISQRKSSAVDLALFCPTIPCAGIGARSHGKGLKIQVSAIWKNQVQQPSFTKMLEWFSRGWKIHSCCMLKKSPNCQACDTIRASRASSSPRPRICEWAPWRTKLLRFSWLIRHFEDLNSISIVFPLIFSTCILAFKPPQTSKATRCYQKCLSDNPEGNSCPSSFLFSKLQHRFSPNGEHPSPERSGCFLYPKNDGKKTHYDTCSKSKMKDSTNLILMLPATKYHHP